MSFFDDVGEIPEEPDYPERVMQPWYGPPEYVIPGSATGSTTVFRNEKVALFFDHFNAFETGLQFTLNLWIREPDSRSRRMWEPPWELHEGGTSFEDPEFLRLGLAFSDGSKWTNMPHAFAPLDEPPPGPILVGQGGGGGGGSWTFRHWLWPLPPAGEMTIHASWPAQGIDETSVAVDATAFVEAAQNAEAIWPD